MCSQVNKISGRRDERLTEGLGLGIGLIRHSLLPSSSWILPELSPEMRDEAPEGGS